jgi:putative membrane protein
MGWYHGGMGWVGWTVMTLLMLVFWVAVVFGAVALARSVRRGGSAGDGSSSPSHAQDLLDERLARGELSPAEYTERRQLLLSGR